MSFGTPATLCGALAQLGERQVRNLEARGSIPLCSTNFTNISKVLGLGFWQTDAQQSSVFYCETLSTGDNRVKIEKLCLIPFPFTEIPHFTAMP